MNHCVKCWKLIPKSFIHNRRLIVSRIQNVNVTIITSCRTSIVNLTSSMMSARVRLCFYQINMTVSKRMWSSLVIKQPSIPRIRNPHLINQGTPSMSYHPLALIIDEYATFKARVQRWYKTVKVWDASTGRELLTLTGHADDVWSVSFTFACPRRSGVPSRESGRPCLMPRLRRDRSIRTGMRDGAALGSSAAHGADP